MREKNDPALIRLFNSFLPSFLPNQIFCSINIPARCRCWTASWKFQLKLYSQPVSQPAVSVVSCAETLLLVLGLPAGLTVGCSLTVQTFNKNRTHLSPPYCYFYYHPEPQKNTHHTTEFSDQNGRRIATATRPSTTAANLIGLFKQKKKQPQELYYCMCVYVIVG